MSPATRTRYFAMWAKACAATGWDPKDDANRREVVLFVMKEVRGPAVTTSDDDFGPAETTALFVYLDHKANPSDLLKAAAWVDVCTDYVAYNQAKQADWHEAKAYGSQGSGKLSRSRFGGKKSAAGEPLDTLDPKAIKQRLLTMRCRNEQRTGYQRKRKPAARVVLPVLPAAGGINLASQASTSGVAGGVPF